MNGEKFKRLRQRERMTQAEFAKLLGLAQSTVANIEAGRYNVSDNTRARIASLNLDVGEEFNSFLNRLSEVEQTFPNKPS